LASTSNQGPYRRTLSGSLNPEGELLAELAGCDAGDMQKLFGAPARAARSDYSAPAGAVSIVEAERLLIEGADKFDQQTAAAPPVVEQPGVTLLNANLPEPQWDERGYRIGPNLPTALRRHGSRHANVARIGRAEIPGVLVMRFRRRDCLM
jgi:hypothetical protein